MSHPEAGRAAFSEISLVMSTKTPAIPFRRDVSRQVPPDPVGAALHADAGPGDEAVADASGRYWNGPRNDAGTGPRDGFSSVW